MRIKILILFIFLFAQRASAETFTVAVPFLPESLSPRDGQLNIGQYISLHLYYPLISVQPDGSMESNFLDLKTTKSKNLNFDEYLMCLIQGLKFSDDTPITTSDLENSIQIFHSINEQAPKIISTKTISKNCIQINLKSSSPNYFSNLQGVASTIIKTSTEYSKQPIGFGPYKISSYSTSEVNLEQITENGRRFDKVTFRKVSPSSFKPEQFDDINPVNALFNPDLDMNIFEEFGGKTYKSYALIISVKNRNFRECLAKYVNADILTSEFGLSLRKIPGFLPEGISGYDVKYEKPNHCKLSGFKPIEMIIPFEKSFANLQRRKIEIFGKMSSYVKLKLIDPNEMSKRIFSRSPYVSIIGFDTSGTNSAFSTEASVYFESFFRENLILPNKIPGLKEVFQSAGEKISKDERRSLYQKAHRITLKSLYVVPLGENQKMKIFRKNIKKVVFADPISGFPQIDKMQ